MKYEQPRRHQHQIDSQQQAPQRAIRFFDELFSAITLFFFPRERKGAQFRAGGREPVFARIIQKFRKSYYISRHWPTDIGGQIAKIFFPGAYLQFPANCSPPAALQTPAIAAISFPAPSCYC